MGWKESIHSLSQKLNISDFGFRSICKKMNIPLPPAGYWQKLKYGKQVEIINLPEDNSVEQEIEINPDSELKKNTFRKKTEVDDLMRLLESDPSLNLKVPERLINPDKLVKATSDFLNDKKERYVYDGVVRSTWDLLDIRVSPESIGRAMRFMDTLIKALYQKGQAVQIRYDTTYAVVEGEEIEMKLREKRKKVIIEDEYKRTEYEATGLLYFQQGRWGWTVEWRDGKNTLEEQLPKILANLLLTGKKRKEDSIRHKREEEERKEKERKIHEFEVNVEKELKDFKSLMKKAKRWHKTNILREFLNAFEKSAIESNTLTSEMEIWLSRQREKTDWYDPFIESNDPILSIVDREKLTFEKHSKWY